MDVDIYIKQNGAMFWETFDEKEFYSYDKPLEMNRVYSEIYRRNFFEYNNYYGILMTKRKENRNITRSYNISSTIYNELKKVANKDGWSINEVVINALEKELFWRKLQHAFRPKTLKLNSETGNYEPDREYFTELITKYLEHIVPTVVFDYKLKDIEYENVNNL